MSEIITVERKDVFVVAAGSQGPAGAQGPVGPPGPQGEPGGVVAGTGDLNYHHVQGTPAATWVIVHNLNKHPTPTVIDSSGSEVDGAVTYDSLNQLTIDFSAGFSGDAYLN
jgi:hypothetical protein